MQAAFIRAARQFLLQDVDIPTPGPHDVVIRVRAAGICGSDLHFHRTGKQNPTPRFAGGHEVSGEVVEVGTQTTLKVGTRVAVEPIIGCEQCSFCLEGNNHLCSSLRHLAPGFAEFAVVPEHKAYPLAPSLSFEAGAMVDGTAVALHALQRVPPTSADTVIIVGDGTIALLLVQLLRLYKPRYIGVIGRHPANLQLIQRLGAHFVLHCQSDSLEKEIMDGTNGEKATIVYECVGGSNSSFQHAVSAVRSGGIIGVLGSFPPPTALDLKMLLLREITIRFCFSYGSWNGQSEFLLAREKIENGIVQVEEIVTHRFSLSRIQEAFDVALNKQSFHAIKVMITNNV